MKKAYSILLVLFLSLSGGNTLFAADEDSGVTINGVTWARTNVARKGQFAAKSIDNGFYYTWSEAYSACPEGWRLPTREEFEGLVRAGGEWKQEHKIFVQAGGEFVEAKGAGWLFGSGTNTLFFPAAGRRDYDGHGMHDVGTGGKYWSSSVNDGSSFALDFNRSSANYYSLFPRTGGFSVRCVKGTSPAAHNHATTPATTTIPALTAATTIWATTNVGEPGAFVAKPEDVGKDYYWEDAQRACPDGWRLPTKAEFESLTAAGNTWTTINGAGGCTFGTGTNTIFMPATVDSHNSIDGEYTNGVYWTSTLYGRTTRYNVVAYFQQFDRDNGVYNPGRMDVTQKYHVRCVKGNPPRPALNTADAITILGVTWATRNVGEPGTFVAKPEDIGKHYTFEEAKTVCPKGWRLPTKEEYENIDALIGKWTTQNGVNGYKLGRSWEGYTGYTIFLPAGGFYAARLNGVFNDLTLYWSSTPGSDGNTYTLGFDEHGSGVTENSNSSDFGSLVRCVKDSSNNSAGQ